MRRSDLHLLIDVDRDLASPEGLDVGTFAGARACSTRTIRRVVDVVRSLRPVRVVRGTGPARSGIYRHRYVERGSLFSESTIADRARTMSAREGKDPITPGGQRMATAKTKPKAKGDGDGARKSAAPKKSPKAKTKGRKTAAAR